MCVSVGVSCERVCVGVCVSVGSVLCACACGRV